VGDAGATEVVFAQLSAHQSLNAQSGLSKSWIQPLITAKIAANA